MHFLYSLFIKWISTTEKPIFGQNVVTKCVSTTGNTFCGHMKIKARCNSNLYIFIVPSLQNEIPPPEINFWSKRGEKSVSPTENTFCGHMTVKAKCNSSLYIFLFPSLQNEIPPPETNFWSNRGDKMYFHW
jgi:hypothetical protein